MSKRPASLAALALVFLPAFEGTLDTKARADLFEWYAGVGAPRAGESFGAYVARTALYQRGAQYEPDGTPPRVRETLHVDFSRFECVSFIESTLAVARCGFHGEPTASCFEREIELSRYRGGVQRDYASRLHYFDDWIDDNEARHRVANLTKELGGEPFYRSYFHISSRVLPRTGLPSNDLARLTRAVSLTESRLSEAPHAVLSRDAAPPVLGGLQDGDLVAFVRDRPGLLVHHAGFVYRAGGKPRLLHASSYHRRVVLTREELARYLLRRPDRQGVIVARPLSP
jgi:hypothetical protein